MSGLRLGILGTSEIAFRRFVPTLLNCPEFEYVGVASRTLEKTKPFVKAFAGKGYGSYEELLADDSIDAVYIPLPPALHYEWGKKALEAGKHILMEKPFTTKLSDTEALLKLAEKKGLALHENYMFQYHSQIAEIQKMVQEGMIGEVRLIRIAFGFPFRGVNDFRYEKALGGGALLDCGGYTLKLASQLLGETTRLVTAQSNMTKGYDVDIFGSATLVNEQGMIAQVSFGMDNSYKCELELWGSTGTLCTNRILTAPVGYAPQVVLKQGNEERVETLAPDDTFAKSIQQFGACIAQQEARETTYQEICLQGKLVQDFMGGKGI